jgi:hypothetical protein
MVTESEIKEYLYGDYEFEITKNLDLSDPYSAAAAAIRSAIFWYCGLSPFVMFLSPTNSRIVVFRIPSGHEDSYKHWYF